MRLSIILAAVLALAVAAVGIFATEKPATEPARERPAAAARPTHPLAATAGGAPAGARRPGKVFRLDDAMKELDLIRPSRQKRADDFTLPTVGEGTFRLSEHRGKPVLINFWATWCPPCLTEMPAMERLYRQHRDAGFVMVAVSVDADPRVVTPFVDQHTFSFPVALDPKMALANTYGVRALPSSFLVDRAGNLAALAIGPRHWDNDASHSLIEGLAR